MKVTKLLRDIPAELPDELTEIILTKPGLRIERILSRGHHSAVDFWYDQEEDEWVLLLQGRARLQFAGKPDPIELSTGDSLNIPAHTRHRVAWTDPGQDTVWLAVFSRPHAAALQPPQKKGRA